MNERKLDHGSRIKTADEGTLEPSIGSYIFEMPDNGLVGKPLTPTAACAAAFAVRDTWQVRDIRLRRFVRSPHRILRHPAALLAGKIR
jgi:hypothetical protein